MYEQYMGAPMKTQEIIDAIVGVCGDIQRSEYRLLELIRELDACKGWAQFGMPSCAHWLNYRCGIDLVTHGRRFGLHMPCRSWR